MTKMIAAAERNAALALGFTAGVIFSGLVYWGGWKAILVLAAVSGLGLIVAWGLREVRYRRIDRSARDRLNRRSDCGHKRRNHGGAAEVEPLAEAAGEPESPPEEIVAFHDFDPSRGRFDHW